MADQIVDNPTYAGHVRQFFIDEDLEHMLARGVDLTTYPALKAAAVRVFLHTRPPNPDMPPDPARHWSQERSTTFRNWMTNNFALGTPTTAAVQAGGADRIRKDARDLSDDEIDALGRGFQGLIDRSPDDPDSYFTLAGLHWYPDPTECLHHEDRFLPWHRALVRRFEDALRTVPGCAQVTLPYWDITAPPPDFLYTAPFASYTLPRDIHPNYPAGFTTSRNTAADIGTTVELFDIPNAITSAMATFDWGTFTEQLASAHDNAHGATGGFGGTMSATDAASFDPIFWLFHANWDRLWWEWQQTMQATSEWSFRSTITTGQTDFLTDPLFKVLPPFPETAEQTIDLTVSGVAYALAHTVPAAGPVPPAITPMLFGSVAASAAIHVAPITRASVMLKGIERLAIPGSFVAVLSTDDEPVARQAYFQSTNPRRCGSCREKPIVNLTFRVDAAAIAGRSLSARIELLAEGADRIGRQFPLSSCGNPTLNVRLLLQDVHP